MWQQKHMHVLMFEHTAMAGQLKRFFNKAVNEWWTMNLPKLSVGNFCRFQVS